MTHVNAWAGTMLMSLHPDVWYTWDILTHAYWLKLI